MSFTALFLFGSYFELHENLCELSLCVKYDLKLMNCLKFGIIPADRELQEKRFLIFYLYKIFS